MQAALQYATEELHIKELAAVYAEENRASGRVLQKLGFRFVKKVPYVCDGGKLVTTGNYCAYRKP